MERYGSWFDSIFSLIIFVVVVIPILFSIVRFIFRKIFSLFSSSYREKERTRVLESRYENYTGKDEKFYRNKDNAEKLVSRYKGLKSTPRSLLYNTGTNPYDVRLKAEYLNARGRKLNTELQEICNAVITPSHPAKIFFLINIGFLIDKNDDLYQWASLGMNRLAKTYSEDESFRGFVNEIANRKQ